MQKDQVQADKDLRQRIIALARERGECEEMAHHLDVQLSKDDCDEIHARRVELGLAS